LSSGFYIMELAQLPRLKASLRLLPFRFAALQSVLTRQLLQASCLSARRQELAERRWKRCMTQDKLPDANRWLQCEGCALDERPGKVKQYTRDELAAHVANAHRGWGLCKGCSEFTGKKGLMDGRGWCALCVVLCLDCMDREKYPE